jgi:hypothetical protein
MNFRSALTLLALAAPASAFMGQPTFSRSLVSVQSSLGTSDAGLEAATEKLVCYFVCIVSFRLISH